MLPEKEGEAHGRIHDTYALSQRGKNYEDTCYADKCISDRIVCIVHLRLPFFAAAFLLE